MADDEEEEGTEDEAAKPKGGRGGIVGLILPALLAGGGAFGGAFFGQPPAAAAVDDTEKVDDSMPGPTVPLNAFVLNVMDKEGGSHAAKVTFAVELKKEVDPKAFEVFVPRIRDTVLTYMRSMSYEEISDGKGKVKLTEDLLAAIHKLGAENAQQVLVQDFVIQ